MNSVNLIGRLTRDPELRYTTQGTAVARFTLAVDRGYSKAKQAEEEAAGRQTADFISITTWGKTAEVVANYTAKGHKLAVEGRIQTSSWTDDKGERRYSTDVVANRIELIETRSNNQEQDWGEYLHPIDNADTPF